MDDFSKPFDPKGLPDFRPQRVRLQRVKLSEQVIPDEPAPQHMETLFGGNGAAFSACRRYRYALWRIWDASKPPVMFIGLNPSTANEDSNDPTIRRVISFAQRWEHGGVYMLNCFPFVSTDPEALRTECDQSLNNDWLVRCGAKSSRIIFAWGSFPIVSELGRDADLRSMFPHAEALAINANGSPRHPLYVKGDTEPIPFQSTAP